MIIVMPLPPAQVNRGDGWHWRRAHRQKKEYYDLCLASVKTKRPAEAMRKAHISAVVYSWNLMDAGDNLHSRLKFAIDFLVRRNYIVDDSPRVLTWGDVTNEIDRRRPRIEIVLEGIIEEAK